MMKAREFMGIMANPSAETRHNMPETSLSHRTLPYLVEIETKIEISARVLTDLTISAKIMVSSPYLCIFQELGVL